MLNFFACSNTLSQGDEGLQPIATKLIKKMLCMFLS